MSLRDKIEQEEVIREAVVEVNGDKYLLRGSADASIMAESILLTPDRVGTLAKHWSVLLKKNIAEHLVKQIATVHSVLVAAVWNKETETWDELPPYDVTEVAAFACKEGPTFIKLLGEAYTVLGFSPEAAAQGVDPLENVMLKNSEEPAGTS